ncbi:unnamed protein product [Vitrella brassicaformis CCMP3155]|uniref:Protein kinase domain-containing protein n=1 Tax=Vitrella brassicaformis (strain CCMP3155) TaxID=1169540 RepID=A0A0G4G8E9_VITBC|nr:unnamed protein product [Vitrella brassicaformis CCMP3155]|eukprot:CEM24806.1 unnamed protein product [Vitrella brassicaformis CCMP3155]
MSLLALYCIPTRPNRITTRAAAMEAYDTAIKKVCRKAVKLIHGQAAQGPPLAEAALKLFANVTFKHTKLAMADERPLIAPLDKYIARVWGLSLETFFLLLFVSVQSSPPMPRLAVLSYDPPRQPVHTSPAGNLPTDRMVTRRPRPEVIRLRRRPPPLPQLPAWPAGAAQKLAWAAAEALSVAFPRTTEFVKDAFPRTAAHLRGDKPPKSTPPASYAPPPPPSQASRTLPRTRAYLLGAFKNTAKKLRLTAHQEVHETEEKEASPAHDAPHPAPTDPSSSTSPPSSPDAPAAAPSETSATTGPEPASPITAAPSHSHVDADRPTSSTHSDEPIDLVRSVQLVKCFSGEEGGRGECEVWEGRLPNAEAVVRKSLARSLGNDDGTSQGLTLLTRRQAERLAESLQLEGETMREMQEWAEERRRMTAHQEVNETEEKEEAASINVCVNIDICSEITAYILYLRTILLTTSEERAAMEDRQHQLTRLPHRHTGSPQIAPSLLASLADVPELRPMVVKEGSKEGEEFEKGPCLLMARVGAEGVGGEKLKSVCTSSSGVGADVKALMDVNMLTRVTAIHRLGIAHNDCHWENVLVANRLTGEVSLIDTEMTRRVRTTTGLPLPPQPPLNSRPSEPFITLGNLMAIIEDREGQQDISFVSDIVCAALTVLLLALPTNEAADSIFRLAKGQMSLLALYCIPTRPNCITTRAAAMEAYDTAIKKVCVKAATLVRGSADKGARGTPLAEAALWLFLNVAINHSKKPTGPLIALLEKYIDRVMEQLAPQ